MPLSPFRRSASIVHLAIGLTFLACTQVVPAQTSSLISGSQIAGPVDETTLVTLRGSTPPLALARFDQGAVADNFPMEHMYLQLRRSPAQEQALSALLKEMQDRQSPKYHHWLTAEELGAQYGPSREDKEAVTSWLSAHGMQVNGVSRSGLTIDVSATAGQIREALHTEIHRYVVRGQEHISNAKDPQIPAALSRLVGGFNSLNDFVPRPAVRKPKANFSFPCTNCPDGFAGYEQYDEAPADFATIYNSAPLYKGKSAITGKGQTVVVLEATDVQPADVAKFRSSFGLSSYSGKFSQIHPGPGCSDPGKNGAEGEAALDAEWAGAVAPDANVELASCASTQTNFGAYIAAQNLLDLATPPPIMSLSYLECEASLGPGGNLFFAEMWEQAALEGVSVFVPAGDGGPAGCDDFNSASYAQDGIAANGLGSTPFNTSTGGTDFLDTAENDNSRYWSSSNSATGKSAKSYIPETTWNESCASSLLGVYLGYLDPLEFCNTGSFLDIVGGSGAPSFVYAKPYWQAGVYGNPNDGVRDLPDVSLFASSGFWFHAILFCMSDAKEGGAPCDYSVPADAFDNSAGGTSFTAPQFASIQALINQKAGGPQGNAAPIYYDLAKLEYGTNTAPNKAGINACASGPATAPSSACGFYDVRIGNNNVPCYGTNDCYGSAGLSYGILSTSDTKLNVAFPSLNGWDFATGLGSINVTNVVNHWP